MTVNAVNWLVAFACLEDAGVCDAYGRLPQTGWLAFAEFQYSAAGGQLHRAPTGIAEQLSIHQVVR